MGAIASAVLFVVLVVLLIRLLGAADPVGPPQPYYVTYGPAGGVGLLLAIVLIMALLGPLPFWW